MIATLRSVTLGIEFPELNQKLGLASDHPWTEAQNDKRLYEYSILAREISELAAHYQCATVATEFLNIETQDHGKGRSFNRMVNNQWCRKGFILPLVRRLEALGIRHAEVNPAYSSKLGNLLWGWPLHIPDPACAAIEIGRRFLQDNTRRSSRTKGGHRRKEASLGDSGSVAEDPREKWRELWNRINPRSGDTPRCTFDRLERAFPQACPRPGPFRSRSSRIFQITPARLASRNSTCIRKEL